MSAKQLTFQIQGEFITKFAREKLNKEHDLPKALQILSDCLLSNETDHPHEKRLLRCLLILNEKAEIRGTYPNDDYRLVVLDEEKDYNIFDELIECLRRCQSDTSDIQSDYNDLLQRYTFVLNYLDLPLYKQREMNIEYKSEYGESLFDCPDDNQKIILNDMLQSYIDRQKNNTDEEDYGWLSPSGIFYPVEWGKHEEWAMKYLMEHYPYAENKDIYKRKQEHLRNGDVLVYSLHWVLLHNPAQGVATPLYDHTRRLTKQQKSFLYDYYIKRNEHDRANQIWSEDD